MYVGLAASPAHGAGGEAEVAVVRAVGPDTAVEVGLVQLGASGGVAALHTRGHVILEYWYYQ